MGADNLINFHKWSKWKEIINNCKILVFDRKGYKLKAIKFGHKNLIIKVYFCII